MLTGLHSFESAVFGSKDARLPLKLGPPTSVYSCCRVVAPSASFLSSISVAVHGACYGHEPCVPTRELLLQPALVRRGVRPAFWGCPFLKVYCTGVRSSPSVVRAPVIVKSLEWKTARFKVNIYNWTSGGSFAEPERWEAHHIQESPEKLGDLRETFFGRHDARFLRPQAYRGVIPFLSRARVGRSRLSTAI